MSVLTNILYMRIKTIWWDFFFLGLILKWVINLFKGDFYCDIKIYEILM